MTPEPRVTNRDLSVRVILTGTDPRDPRGGIGVAMRGTEEVLRRTALLDRLVPSYRPDSLAGKTWLALRATLRIVRRARRIRREGGVPVVYGHAGAGLGLLRQSLVLAVARAAGARTMLQLHSVTVDEALRRRSGRAFLRTCLWPADTVCVLTEWWRRRLAEGISLHRLVVVPNALSAELEERAHAGRGTRDFSGASPLRVLAMTRLEPGKGLDILLRAVAGLGGSWRLVVAGTGPERERLESLAASLELGDRVRFSGWVSGAEKDALFRTSDVYCLPTTFDSFGMGFLEAMAWGLPVVAADFGPIADIVPHDCAGFLVGAGDAHGVTRALERLRDPALLRRMGAEGRQWVLERFSTEAVGRQLTAAVALTARGRPAAGGP